MKSNTHKYFRRFCGNARWIAIGFSTITLPWMILILIGSFGVGAKNGTVLSSSGKMIPILEFTPSFRFLNALSLILPLIFIFFFFFILGKLLHFYAKGGYFEPYAPRTYRKLANLTLLYWLCKVPLTALLEFTEKHISIIQLKLDPSAYSTELPVLFLSILLYALSYIMAEGTRLYEEQKLTV
ncbi:MAG: DUF2975 domain-containing protein [Verrucomicrobiota bacterium]